MHIEPQHPVFFHKMPPFFLERPQEKSGHTQTVKLGYGPLRPLEVPRTVRTHSSGKTNFLKRVCFTSPIKIKIVTQMVTVYLHK